MKKGRLPEPGSPWTDVFARSTLGAATYSVKHTAPLHMQFMGYGLGGHPTWDRIVEICKDLGVHHKNNCCGSPANADCLAEDYAFLDGGVFSRGGTYLGGLHGAWVYGIKTLRFLCYELRLIQPRKIKEEARIPTSEELLREIEEQMRLDRQILEDRIERSRATHGS